jgi:hypothetical protein
MAQASSKPDGKAIEAMRRKLHELVSSAFLEDSTRSALLLTDLVAFVRQKFPDLSAAIALEEVLNAAADAEHGFNLEWAVSGPSDKPRQLASGTIVTLPKPK